MRTRHGERSSVPSASLTATLSEAQGIGSTPVAAGRNRDQVSQSTSLTLRGLRRELLGEC